MITAVVPVSPIRIHPDISILTQTLDSVRACLPDAELLVTFDGVRSEQESRRADYEESIRRTLWQLDKHYRNACPFVFDAHKHQSGMLRAVLDEIRTPLMLYVEQDCPIVTDELIDWEAIAAFIETGHSNLVRLHHEALILDAHQHMCHGVEPFQHWADRKTEFVRTSQWSQRPHVASVAYYRRIMDAHFSPAARCFIEDRMHGVADQAFRIDGLAGWHQHRLHIYDPGRGNMKRSYTTDGRGGEPKFDDAQIF